MRMSILGLGLLGGSLGLTLRRLEPAEHVTGWARRDETMVEALELGAIDGAAASPAEAGGAAVSHVPFLVQTALVLATAGDPAWPVTAPLAASGYRDASRLAAGDPVMYRDICLTNGPAILPVLDAVAAELAALRREIAAGDA